MIPDCSKLLIRNRLENTVIKLCNYLHDKLCFNIPKDELSLRRELVACILSSQMI